MNGDSEDEDISAVLLKPIMFGLINFTAQTPHHENQWAYVVMGLLIGATLPFSAVWRVRF